MSRRLPITRRIDGGQFFIRENGKYAASSVFLALVAIELTDVLMVIDSIAVAFSMSRNTFVIYTSNVFAIFGLRALYLVLAQTIAHLRYLHYGLSVVLAFAGIKLLIEPLVEIPPLAAVAVTITLIGASIWASLGKESSVAGLGRSPKERVSSSRYSK